MIEVTESRLSILRQCELLNLNRTSYYWSLARKEWPSEDEYNLLLMRLIDELYTKYPFYGSRKMASHLRRLEYPVNRKRVRRLMKKMGLVSVAPKPNTSQRAKGHKIYPYLLRGLEITRPNHVWCTDITYIRLPQGFVYLVAVVDWASRKVLSWEVSNTMEESFCISALERALRLYGQPEIFNTDQGAQFTSRAFTGILKNHEIRISMDGKGRALDNIMVERLWRSVKYEEVYLHEYESVTALKKALNQYFHYFNYERPHQSFGDSTPAEVYEGKQNSTGEKTNKEEEETSNDLVIKGSVGCCSKNTLTEHPLIHNLAISTIK